MPAKKAPWDKPNPASKTKELTESQKRQAKSRAKKAGRSYPNLVDNMAVAKSANKRTAKSVKKSAAKKTSKEK